MASSSARLNHSQTTPSNSFSRSIPPGTDSKLSSVQPCTERAQIAQVSLTSHDMKRPPVVQHAYQNIAILTADEFKSQTQSKKIEKGVAGARASVGRLDPLELKSVFLLESSRFGLVTNRLLQHLQSYFAHYVNSSQAAMVRCNSEAQRDQVRTQLVHLIIDYDSMLLEYSRAFGYKHLVSIVDVDRDKSLMRAAANVFFNAPLADTRTKIKTLPEKKTGVRTLKVVGAVGINAEPETYFFVNRSSRRGKSLGKGSFGVTKVALPADHKGQPLRHISSNELANKKHRLMDIMDVVGVYKETMIMKQCLGHENLMNYRAVVCYPSFKHTQYKTVSANVRASLPLQIGMIMPKGNPLRIIDHVKLSRQGVNKLHQQNLLQLHFYRQICSGLGALHKKNIVHNDLKHPNVLVMPKKQVRIIDFGLAFSTSGTLKQNLIARRQLGGTFFPPEIGIFRGQSDRHLQHLAEPHKIDVWALGQMLLHDFFPALENQSKLSGVLAGYYDLDHSNALVRHAEFIQSQMKPYMCSGFGVANVVYGCLDPKPANRWSVEQVKQAIRSILVYSK